MEKSCSCQDSYGCHHIIFVFPSQLYISSYNRQFHTLILSAFAQKCPVC
ncbi:SWIM zinc finger family protein [Blautia sp. HCP3S3_D9]|nr:SWIM zinc finger family protein [Blautia sp. MSJ-9]